MSRLFDLPPLLEENLEKRLNEFSHSLKKPKELADAIRALSNLFLKGISNNDYWQDRNHRAAYLAYFAVLNFLKARAVFREGFARDFFKDSRVILDWGCGAGSATWAYFAEAQKAGVKCIGVDSSQNATNEYKHWLDLFEIKALVQKLGLEDFKTVKADTVIFSYVLNEVEDWPEFPDWVERVVIIEPSTHQAGRRMLEWRNQLLKNGWFAWAPCTHQLNCPLITHSGKDWCHDRIKWTKPEWFFDLEEHLPMRNDTLTMSYLLLSREKPAQDLKGWARVVGDEQEEKGKSRQLICRGELREFLSWLHRDQISLKLSRGDIIQIGNFEQRVNELRIFSASDIKKL